MKPHLLSITPCTSYPLQCSLSLTILFNVVLSHCPCETKIYIDASSLCRLIELLCHQVKALVHPTEEDPTAPRLNWTTVEMLEDKLEEAVVLLRFMETVWEAAPQLTLQVYIKLTTDRLPTLLCKNQWSIVLSLQLSCSYVVRLAQFL